MTNRSRQSGHELRSVIFHNFSFVIGHLPNLSQVSAVVRKKCSVPHWRGKGQTVLLTRKGYPGPCPTARDATIFSHALRLCGEIFLVAAMPRPASPCPPW